MSTGGVKRATCETQQADDHPFRMAKPRIEIPPLQADSSTTEQRLSPIELQVDSLNTFATMIEQTLPQLKELYDRVAVVEENFQNVGKNVEQLVAKSVEQQHQELKDQMERMAGDIPEMKHRIDDVMLEAEKQIQQKLLELTSDDKRLEDTLKHVANCTEQEVAKIKACTEGEIERVKTQVSEEFQVIKSGIETFAAKTEHNSRIDLLEAGTAMITSEVADAKRIIKSNRTSREHLAGLLRAVT